MAAKIIFLVLWVTNEHLLVVMIWAMCQGTGLGVPGGLAAQEALSNPLSSLWDSVEISKWRENPTEGTFCSPCWSTALQAPEPQRSSLRLMVDVLFPGHLCYHSSFFNCSPALPPRLTNSICSRRGHKGASRRCLLRACAHVLWNV